jgi:SAM-dependent methyltransferase
MDATARYLSRRWKALGDADAVFCRPWTEIDEPTARSRIDPAGRLGDLGSKDVLCLASGGGQQSIAFAILGARVTVLDLDEGQLERDRNVARGRGIEITTRRGDMRELPFEDDSFDVVWQPYSINFVPEIDRVIDEVARVLRLKGAYVLMTTNPFALGLGTRDWNGEGFVVRRPYIDGASYEFTDEDWVAEGIEEVPPPREYLHTLGGIVHQLTVAGFRIRSLDEATGSTAADPGSWEHLKATVPPWLTFWCTLEDA